MEGERQRGKGVKQNLTVSTLYRGIAKAMNIITIRWACAKHVLPCTCQLDSSHPQEQTDKLCI